MENVRVTLSQNIAALRGSKTQDDFAESVGLSKRMIQKIEYQESWPSDETLGKIARAMKLDVAQLLTPSLGRAELTQTQTSMSEAIKSQQIEIDQLKAELDAIRNDPFWAVYEKAVPSRRLLAMQALTSDPLALEKLEADLARRQTEKIKKA